MMNSLPRPGASAADPPAGILRVGTWNVSHWTAAKANIIASDIGADITAVQETHLAAFPLECAHGTARRVGLHLYHGQPVPPLAQAVYGRSCGVGFLAQQGVALSPVLPQGAAWRRLHAMGRLHAVRLMPRTGLQQGILLLSIYAPLQVRAQRVLREQFVELLLEVTHALDMQTPTLLLGDFNGSADPPRDFLSESGKNRPVCPLLAQLLGPGAAWVDVHRSLMQEVPWTFQNRDSQAHLSASRIDLVLANHSAMALICQASVLQTVSDGGHSPVLVGIRLDTPAGISWHRPRPRLPPLLCCSSSALAQSTEWRELIAQWLESPQVVRVLDIDTAHTASSLSTALVASLQHLVALAGGWVSRPAVRRQAYDSAELRLARRVLGNLHSLSRLVHKLMVGPAGSWPRSMDQLLSRLDSDGLCLPRDSAAALMPLVEKALSTQKALVARITKELRKLRHERWSNSLASLWRDRPGVVFNWLHAVGAPWGSTPILDSTGNQCTTIAAVDAAVQAYWVKSVLRQHADVDTKTLWNAFLESPFGSHIPKLQWPTLPWTGERVRQVLGKMREGAAPGSVGIPLAVWKMLPTSLHEALARLLTLVETERTWPVEWVHAYVAMIPKSAGGSRPQDQRPITVLDVLYRIWSKGVVLAWTPVLQEAYLGPTAMGFRAGTGTLHVVQLLTDLIALQRKRRAALWFASFDVEKCYDSLPWWAVFGVMSETGIPSQLVACFQSFYGALERRFRFGQVDGDVWRATNGLAQGCPASPDLLNILMEPFHCWAVAEGHGVEVMPGCRVASVSFADDVAMVAGSKKELETLVAAYLQWCSLLGVRVTKVQAWTNLPGNHLVKAADKEVPTSPTFKMVGVVLGTSELIATKEHFAPRLERALATTRRLRMLDLPAALCGLMWKMAVLPQALYGCEVRDVRPSQLVPLTSAGQAAVASKFPLHLNCWRAPEVLMGPPLGDSAIREPMLEVRERQLRWLHVLINLPSTVGLAHRVVAGMGDTWQELPGALASALHMLGWHVRRNGLCSRAQQWPLLESEVTYPGSVEMQPVDSFPPLRAVFTDGSIIVAGGSAAWQPDEDVMMQVKLTEPRSSTHCELVALGLGMQLCPPVLLTDSMAALQMLRGWGKWSTTRSLSCVDRREVRWVIAMARQNCICPTLEKVKAHDAQALELGHPKAVGNDKADKGARHAASSEEVSLFTVDLTPFGDPVEIVNAMGVAVQDVRQALAAAWWDRRHKACSSRRPWLEKLYPTGVAMNWTLSNGVFCRPVVSGHSFVHSVPAAVVKWVARTRAGCLASRLRLFRHRMESSPACPCCGTAEEDEEHVVMGCPGTGSVDWLSTLRELWVKTASELSLSTAPPSETVLGQFRLPLLAAVIPSTVIDLVPLPQGMLWKFLKRYHLALATNLAEKLRRREALIAALAAPMVGASSSTTDSSPAPTQSHGNSLPPERQFMPVELRRLEVQRRSMILAPTPVPLPTVPQAGEARRRWLRSRLEQLLREDTSACSEAEAVGALDFLALFETVTGELFADTPGIKVASRVSGMGRVLGNITREIQFDSPLQQFSRRGRAYWNRRPHALLDALLWKECVLHAEQFALPTVRLREQRVECNAGLADWIRQHRHLRPTDVESGESGMALLMLWEIDHGRPFPKQGGSSSSSTLVGFTRRLQLRVQEDAVLRTWFTCRYMQRPLAPGLPTAHHSRWSVRIVKPAPTEPQGWYEEFVRRWRAHLEEIAMATAPSPVEVPMAPEATPTVVAPPQHSQSPATIDVASSSHEVLPAFQPVARQQVPVCPRRRTPSSQPLLSGPGRVQPPDKRRKCGSQSDSTQAPVAAREQQEDTSTLRRRREGDSAAAPPAKRRQGDLRQWLVMAGHGRAQSGPPT